jgi:serine/threonine-protein phosphatase 5
MATVSAADALKLEGNAHLKNHEYEQAISAYERAIELDPTNAIYYSNKAQVELKIEQYGAAIIDCTKAIEIDPKFLKSYHRRALANYQLFKFKEAKEDLKVILNQKEDAASRALLKNVVKVERKIAFEKAIRVEHEDDDLFKVEKYTGNFLSDDHKSDKYAGPVLDFEIVENDQGVKELDIKNLNDELIWKFVDWFKKGEKLNKRTILVLLLKVFTILEKEPVYKEIEQSKDEVFTIVGDVHGQFYDLINFFETNGLVSPTHSYLFNGDFVDRGSWSCEVIILLYLLKVLYPNKIFLNRGNHETKDMNKLYGFEDECKYKYGENIFKMFQKSFKELSLITLLNNEYLIMHGGLLSNEETELVDL